MPDEHGTFCDSVVASAKPLTFATRADLDRWLKKYHAAEREVWVRIFKKDSSVPSVDWNDCVICCLTWGWIDGQKRPLDKASFLQRLTPRRPTSSWSKKNRAHAETLIAEGRMQPAGLVHVEAARTDGRWAQAYAGSSEMVIPDDFLRAVKQNPAAKKFYSTLNRANLYAIYHRLQTAKKPETRLRRIESMVAQLAAGKRFH